MKDIDTEKEIFTFLERKLGLFSQYLSVTERMQAALEKKEAGNLGSLISKRQDLIHKIETHDKSMQRFVQTIPDRHHLIPEKFKGLIDNYLKTLKNVMEAVEPLDRELMEVVKQEGECIKTDLLGMRKVQQAAKGYGNNLRHPPRFLDTRR
uniref:Uncharacterized protein n=1 Tax=Candidatus Desulfatibia profunda TaxID=2841695 RepID=A0A8J6NPU0_9BACT|nr:hypothetical protein [Candidatus Desulfatibia profunda]